MAAPHYLKRQPHAYVTLVCWDAQLVAVIYSLGGMNYQTDSLLFQKTKDD